MEDFIENLTKHLLYEGTDIGRQNVARNIAGSFVYALASMVLSFLVIRVVRDDQGGTFPFGFSTPGQQMFTVAYFGICPFQITDGTGRYPFGDYLEYRDVTRIMALGAGAVFLTFMHSMGHYTADECMILILLVIYKVIDGYVDVYEPELQRQGGLYLTGKSSFSRTPFSVSVFLVMLTAFEHLLFSYLAMAAAQTVGTALPNLDVIHTPPSMDWNKGKRKTGRLFKSISFLLISVFLDFYVFLAAKYAIDARLNNAASGYFSLIFMPTPVICMVANFVIRPFLTRLINLWTEEGYDCLRKELRYIDTTILGLTVPAMGATAILGKWVLSVMEVIPGSGYEERLVSYYRAFIIIVLGGGSYTLINLMYYTLVIICRQKAILTVYLAAAAAAVVSSGFLTSKLGINGATGCCLLLMMELVTGFGLHTTGACQSEKKENTGNGGSNT